MTSQWGFKALAVIGMVMQGARISIVSIYPSILESPSLAPVELVHQGLDVCDMQRLNCILIGPWNLDGNQILAKD